MTSTDLDAAEASAAAEGGAVKRAYVRRIFSEIAPRYDLLNHLLSFNIDKRWRAKAIRELAWARVPDGIYLDLCAGTLDVGAQLLRETEFRGFVVGTDFALPMLQAGAGKATRDRLAPVNGDALDLPYRDEAIDGAIVAFGIRNLADLSAGLREVRRVLKPGGRFVILEFSTPKHAVVRTGYHAYFHNILPWIGGIVSGHKSAYKYLPQSVANFPVQDELARRMREAGYKDVSY
ncbi:MAG: ubiquinone/menaquinone biosynthesis methyltransferase, partial [Gemmatimonadota bacterium]